jgi:hypothetical protein
MVAILTALPGPHHPLSHLPLQGPAATPTGHWIPPPPPFSPSPSTTCPSETLPPTPCLGHSPSSRSACAAASTTPRPLARPRRPCHRAALERRTRGDHAGHARSIELARPLCHWVRPKAGSRGPQCGPVLYARVFDFSFLFRFLEIVATF